MEDVLKELYVDETWAEANRDSCEELPKVEMTKLDLQWLQVNLTHEFQTCQNNVPWVSEYNLDLDYRYWPRDGRPR